MPRRKRKRDATRAAKPVGNGGDGDIGAERERLLSLAARVAGTVMAVIANAPTRTTAVTAAAAMTPLASNTAPSTRNATKAPPMSNDVLTLAARPRCPSGTD